MADPCLSCTLPDCDDDHPRCGLRMAIKRRMWLYRRGMAIPPEVQQAATHAYSELYIESHARSAAKHTAARSEARRQRRDATNG